MNLERLITQPHPSCTNNICAHTENVIANQQVKGYGNKIK